ncbi:WDR61 family protein [Megaselia abdita]
MFSLTHKEENAHTESIYSCAWSQYKIEEDDNEDDEMGERTQDFLLTAGLDNVIKIWNIREDNSLELKNELNGHSLGVVSVDVSPDGRSGFSCYFLVLLLFLFVSQLSRAVPWTPVFASGRLKMVR